MADIVMDYFDRPTSLFLASYAGDYKRLGELLTQKEHKDNINHPVNTQGKHTPLFFACYGDANVETVKELLNHGADPLLLDNIGRTVLHIAANTADPAILQTLLEQPGIIEFVDSAAEFTGQTPFHALCLPGSGAGPDKKGKDANVVACLQMLLDKSKNTPLQALNTKDKNNLTPIMLAKQYNNTELLESFEKLIGKDALDSVNVPDNIETLLKVDFYGRTPLLEAAFVNNKETVIRELDNLENPDQVNIQSDRNALQLACCGISDGEMVDIILAKITNPIAADKNGRTALHFAANTGRIDTVTVLLNNETIRKNINILDGNNRTALHALAMASSRVKPAEGEELSSREKVIELLFANGIDFDAKDVNNDTALDIAEQRGNIVVASRLRICIASVMAKRTATAIMTDFLPGFTALQQHADTNLHTAEKASNQSPKNRQVFN